MFGDFGEKSEDSIFGKIARATAWSLNEGFPCNFRHSGPDLWITAGWADAGQRSGTHFSPASVEGDIFLAVGERQPEFPRLVSSLGSELPAECVPEPGHKCIAGLPDFSQRRGRGFQLCEQGIGIALPGAAFFAQEFAFLRAELGQGGSDQSVAAGREFHK